MKPAIKIIDFRKINLEKTLIGEFAAVGIRKRKNRNKVPDLKNYKLLIAEDDIFSFEILKYQLAETNAALYHANTGVEAIEMINTEKIDIVILDLQLPEIDGFEVLKIIRQTNKNLPVIAHTAFAFKKEIEKISKHGFSDFILKPYPKEDLYNLLHKYVKDENHSFSRLNGNH